MAAGSALTEAQINSAIAYNGRLAAGLLGVAAPAIGGSLLQGVDAAFIRLVADWQERVIGKGQGDGKIGPKTEAYLGVPHPKALVAVQRAKAIFRSDGILFDDWGNDLRDNDNDGLVDGETEQNMPDGFHSGKTYTKFAVVADTYPGQGWEYKSTVIVRKSKVLTGSFTYQVCADIVSRAYYEAAVMPRSRSTATILQKFRALGYVWHRSESWPPTYVPGDFICTLEHGSGHSGIVVEAAASHTVPKVIELPGPSTMADEGTYDPARTHDVRLGAWTKRNHAPEMTYLGRLLLTKLKP